MLEYVYQLCIEISWWERGVWRENSPGKYQITTGAKALGQEESLGANGSRKSLV